MTDATPTDPSGSDDLASLVAEWLDWAEVAAAARA